MTQTTPERKPCGVCGKESSVNADGTIRHHITNNPDFQADPTPHTSNKCKGAGQPPAGAGAPGDTADGPQCRLCKHPVQLTGNGRVRSHLTPEAAPRPCPAGSDFPLGVYPNIIGTTDGLVATLVRDCGHVPAGECYGCAGVAVPDPTAEAQVTSSAPWGVDAESVAQPTMADQLKAVGEAQPQCSHPEHGTDQYGDRACIVCGEVDREAAAADDDTRSEAGRFLELVASGGLPRSNQTPVGVYPNADSAAVADAVVKLGPAAGLHVTDHRPDGFDPRCQQCDTDNHRCPGCGDSVLHGTVACTDCDRRTMANRIPPGVTEDGRPCHHDDAQFGIENDRLVCVACGTPCTHPDGFPYAGTDEDGADVNACLLCGTRDRDAAAEHDESTCAQCQEDPDYCPSSDYNSGRMPDQARDDEWRTPDDLMAKMSEEIRGMDALRFNCADCGHPITPLVDQFALDGRAAVVTWACEPSISNGHHACKDHECRPDCLVNVGDLEFGNHFVRRGVLMRCTSSGYGVVEAVVVEGPMKGRTGELKNAAEQVERTYCRHNWVAEVPPGGVGFAGPGCEYCGDLKETTECLDDRTAAQRQRSSAAGQAAGTTVPAQAPGSKPPTKASALAASPESNPATSSAPTVKASTNDRSAAVTTDQDAAAAAFLGGGRPAAPAVNQADAAAQFLAGNSGAHGEVETKRDRFGRYLIPHPDTGKEQAWTRATTFAKSISDTYALSQWGLRMALLGATVRPDIVQRAHGKHVKADKQLLDELTADLKSAAGDKVAANLGTSMHSFTEMADRAWHSPGGARSVLDQVPPDCRPMVETYIRLLEETGLEPVPHLIEFTTVVKQYGVAGTSDNCYKVTKPLKLKIGRAEVHLAPGEYVIGDKKTGKDLDYGWQEIVIQLATYAQGINTAGVWDRKNEVWEPDPLNGSKVRLDAGIVIHLPVDKEAEKQPAVYGVDLESGWNAAVLCERVRAWRKVRYLASPVMVSEAPSTFEPSRPSAAAVVKSAPMVGDSDPDTGVTTRTTVRPASLKDRAANVTSKSEASAVWTDAKKQGLPDSEVDELIAVMQARLKKLTEPGG